MKFLLTSTFLLTLLALGSATNITQDASMAKGLFRSYLCSAIISNRILENPVEYCSLENDAIFKEQFKECCFGKNVERKEIFDGLVQNDSLFCKPDKSVVDEKDQVLLIQMVALLEVAEALQKKQASSGNLF